MHAFCRSYIGTYRPDYLLSYTLQQACQVSRIAGVTHAIDFFTSSHAKQDYSLQALVPTKTKTEGLVAIST